MNFFGWTATHVKSIMLLGTISQSSREKKEEEKFVILAIHDG
jgi:hypothetical protein